MDPWREYMKMTVLDHEVSLKTLNLSRTSHRVFILKVTGFKGLPYLSYKIYNDVSVKHNKPLLCLVLINIIKSLNCQYQHMHNFNVTG